MKRHFTLISILSLYITLAFSSSSRANDILGEDDTVPERVISTLQLDRSKIKSGMMIQKVLPYDAGQTLIAFPYITGSPDDESMYDADAYIIIIDNNSQAVLGHLIEPGAWTSDAVVLDDISFDTTAYRLNKEQQAFGIRVSYYGTSRPNPYNRTDLSLYMLDGKKVKKILDNVPLLQSGGEWDTVCEGLFQNSKSTVLIDDKTASDGYNDILIRTRTIEQQKTRENGNCTESTLKDDTSVRRMKFKNGEYK